MVFILSLPFAPKHSPDTSSPSSAGKGARAGHGQVHPHQPLSNALVLPVTAWTYSMVLGGEHSLSTLETWPLGYPFHVSHSTWHLLPPLVIALDVCNVPLSVVQQARHLSALRPALCSLRFSCDSRLIFCSARRLTTLSKRRATGKLSPKVGVVSPASRRTWCSQTAAVRR